jgi:hypothetical protein
MKILTNNIIYYLIYNDFIFPGYINAMANRVILSPFPAILS